MIVAFSDKVPGSKVAIGAGEILDDHRLPPTQGQPLGEKPSNISTWCRADSA